MTKVAFSILFLFVFASLSFAQDRKIESKYFTIISNPDIDILDIAQCIDVGASEHLILENALVKADYSKVNQDEEVLIHMIDALFLSVSDILDIHLYRFKGDIKIARNSDELNKEFKKYFNWNLDSASFYYYPENTIYVAADSLNQRILGHEIAHAIISHYFVVLPSEKIQEILAGYVDYSLKKHQR